MKAFTIYTVLAILCAGCSQTGTVEKNAKSRVDTPGGMLSYLEKRMPPALLSVELWENEYGEGVKLKTAHYEIYTTLLDPLMLPEVPGFMESAYRGYQNQLPEIIESASPFVIYLFANRQQWEKFTDTAAGAQSPMYKKIKAGAYYLNGSCVAYNIGRERTFAVLGHEGWHQFNSRHFKYRLPSWLDEGIAMQFETFTQKGGIFTFNPGKNLGRLGALKLTMQSGRMIPLRQLISINPGEVVTVSDEAVGAFYSQAYALVRFLREENYSQRLGNYYQLLMGGYKGTWALDETLRRVAENRNIPLTTRWNSRVGNELFAMYIGDVEQIEKEYRQFCGKIVYHVHFK